MTPSKLEQKLLTYTKDLPEERLLEIIEFAQVIKTKELERSIEEIKAEIAVLRKPPTDHTE